MAKKDKQTRRRKRQEKAKRQQQRKDQALKSTKQGMFKTGFFKYANRLINLVAVRIGRIEGREAGATTAIAFDDIMRKESAERASYFWFILNKAVENKQFYLFKFVAINMVVGSVSPEFAHRLRDACISPEDSTNALNQITMIVHEEGRNIPAFIEKYKTLEGILLTRISGVPGIAIGTPGWNKSLGLGLTAVDLVIRLLNTTKEELKKRLIVKIVAEAPAHRNPDWGYLPIVHYY